MQYKEIVPGDFVDVYMENNMREMDVEVLYVPSSPDDAWIFQRHSGTIVYIKDYIRMVKLRVR